MPYTPDTESLDAALSIASEAADSAAVLTLPRSFEETMHEFDPVLDTAHIQEYMTADITLVGLADTIAVAEIPDWEEGLEPEIRANQPGNHNFFIAAIAILFVVLVYNFRHLRRLFKTYVEELVKVRRGRDNVFDERFSTDARILILLIIQFVVCGGILLSGAVSIVSGQNDEPIEVIQSVKVIGIMGAYYIFQLVAYEAVGYTFTTPEGRREWVRGFNASQALLGMSLAIPAIVTLFYPATMLWTVAIGVFIYLLARILFILKGFRIFYDKISSLLYFILYLCTLEIIPLIWVYLCSVYEFV